LIVLPAAEKKRAISVLKILQSSIPIQARDFASILVNEESHDPFRVLVVTILSQSCTDIAAIKAYRTLEKQVGITPRSLSQAEVNKISNSIRVAGLQRQKSRALKQLARIILQNYSGDISPILRKPAEEAREELQNFPKVGPKTADVLLSVWGSATISVDTHVERVSKRLGFTPSKAKYAKIRSDLLRLFEVEDYGKIPLLFMAHGRRYCKAIRPLCSTCPIRGFCPYPARALL